jgi:hypothetical protein
MQEKAILETRPVLRKAIEEVYASISATASPRTLVIADLGYASSPNTLRFVLEVMSTIRTCSSKPEDAALPRRCSSLRPRLVEGVCSGLLVYYPGGLGERSCFAK